MLALRSSRFVFGAGALCTVVACGASSGSHGRAGAAPGDPGVPEPAPTGPGTASNGAATGGGDGASTGGDDELPFVPYRAFDVNHVISTGQSNSVAHEGRPVLTTAQPFSNLMFDVGVMTSGDCDDDGCMSYQKPTSFAPLVEGDSFWYPVETMSNGLADEAAMLAKTRHRERHDVLVSLAGRNGLTYWCLRKGGCPYKDPAYVVAFDENTRQVADAKAIAQAAGKSYVVRLVTAIHGESDDYGYEFGTPEFPLDGSDGSPKSLASYADALLEWQRDYQAAVQAITGQTIPVPLVISQVSNWAGNDGAERSFVTQLQFEAMVRTRGMVTIAAPGYPLEFASDCRHYTNHSERRLGEYFGKVYAHMILEGRRWLPLHPTNVTLAGDVITARFHVPVPPLVLDTERVVDPGHYGFEVVDGTGRDVAITNVALAGPDTVKVTLARAPSGAKLRYAFRAAPGACAGPMLGPRGNLRDSDTTPSEYGYELFNWAVHFEVPAR